MSSYVIPHVNNGRQPPLQFRLNVKRSKQWQEQSFNTAVHTLAFIKQIEICWRYFHGACGAVTHTLVAESNIFH